MKNSVSQLDLLKPGESQKSSKWTDALLVACSNFDFRFLIPGWGAGKIKDEQYTKAMQTLNQEDEMFYDEDANQYIHRELKDRGFEGVIANGEDLVNVMSIGGESIETIEDMIETLKNVSDADQAAIDSYMDFVNWNGKEFDAVTELRAWNKHAEKLSEAMSIFDIFITACETYSRAESWNENAIENLKVLKNLEVDNYGENKEYVKRIKKIAEQCYQEKEDELGAAANQAIADGTFLMLEKAFTETTPVGKIADCFMLAANTGISVAKCFGNVANDMEKAELSYMVTCLINVAVASRIDAEIKYDQLNLANIHSGQVDDFRNAIRTSIRSNLRCWSYIYYLNSDGKWENSFRGYDVKSKINKMNTYLKLLDESAKYDYALDEYDLNVKGPGEILDILKGDEVGTSIFEAIPKHFTFTSGAGAWATSIDIEDDGTFVGQYNDADMGGVGEKYPNGTVYICDFKGKFSKPKQVNQYTYSMELEYLDAEGEVGNEYYKNDVRYVYAEPHGFQDAEEFHIYLPGIELSKLPEGFLGWLRMLVILDDNEKLPDDCYGIYNVNAEKGFVGFFETDKAPEDEELFSTTQEASEEKIREMLLEETGMNPVEYYYDTFANDYTYGIIAIYQYDSQCMEKDNCQVWYCDGTQTTQLFEWENTSGSAFCNVDNVLLYKNSKGIPYVILNTWQRVALSYNNCQIFGVTESGDVNKVYEVHGSVTVEKDKLLLEEVITDLIDGCPDRKIKRYWIDVIDGEVQKFNNEDVS